MRVEKGTHQFSTNGGAATTFDESLGPTIVAAFKDAQKEL